MKKTLKSTLIIPYSLIAVLLVLTLSVLFNVTETRTFEQYAKKQRKNQISRIVAQVGRQEAMIREALKWLGMPHYKTG